MKLFLILLSSVVFSVLSVWADPNNINQCGQYNAYMGNLCDYDKNLDTDSKYSTQLPICSDCNASSVHLFDKTKAPLAEKSEVNGGNTDGTQ